jgi:hypothetical protein
MRSLVRDLTVMIATLLALAITGFGQSATTSLRGTIADTKGAVVSGAKVTLNNKSTGFARTVTTDDQGAYQFLEVPPSTYVLTATAAGFSTTKRENLVLQVSSPATMNLSLEVQGTSVVVDVTGEAPVVNTQDASQGHVFGANQLIELPSEGRDPVSILSLQPGVTFIGNNTDTSNDSRGGAVSGARSDQTNVTWDGLDNNDQLNGFAFQGALRATLDSLQEFRVTTTNSNADSGRSSGAQVNLVTKSGTNNFHGSLYEYNRNAFTAANDWFNKQAQLRQGLPNQPGQLIRNTFGASIGGPIKKDRIFFFATYEGQRTRETDQVTRTIPSNNLRNGIISYKCDQTDPACAAGQPGISQAVDGSLVMTLTPTQFAQMDPFAAGNGQCPWATANGCGADPNALNIFKTYPQPNTDAAGDGLDYRGYTFAGLHPKKLDTYREARFQP